MPDSNSTPVTAHVDGPGAPPAWLPKGAIVLVPGRGEFFVRRHVHHDPAAPTVVLLHGWTASADLQFVAAYRALGDVCSFVGIDHRGHGRGFRSATPFDLADVADDAAAVVHELGLSSVIALGYSMGGAISLLMTRRHPDLVAGLVVQASALEWSATRRERVMWKFLPLMGSGLRSWTQPLLLRKAIDLLIADRSELATHREWLVAEALRNEPRAMVQAGRALSRFDARGWAGDLGVPAGVLVSTKDRLIRPRKQRQLAAALRATVVEVAMDHIGALSHPTQFSSATVELVATVAAALPSAPDGSIDSANPSI